jgi:hypothetical protein
MPQDVEGYLDVNTYDWESAFNEANQAINHAKPFDQLDRLPKRIDREDVIEVYHFHEGENDGDPWVMVGKAMAQFEPTPWPRGPVDQNGMVRREVFFSLSAWCDYTGWDCQAGGRLQVDDKDLRAVLVYGLSDSERELLGISLADVDRLPPIKSW